MTMNKKLYQILVYVTLLFFALTFAFFVYETYASNGFNVYSIICLVLSIVCLICFVLNQILYRQFKKRDSSLYEEIECPHCHTMNRKKETFCRNCGKALHTKK